MPLWSYFPIGLALFFGGLIILSAIAGFPDEVSPKAAILSIAPLWMLVLLLVLVPVGEALLWTVFFTEAIARVFRAPILGAVCGVFAYSVLFHGPEGLLAVAVSGWFGTVLGFLYIVMRVRSRWGAFINVVCLRWAFVAYIYVLVI